MALSELGPRRYEGLVSPERIKSSLVVVTDLEGPHLLGDTALDVMSTFVRPIVNGNGIDHGATLYGETYNWFEENFDTKGLGQEGSDIVLAMPALLYFGVTEEMIVRVAAKSLRTPGSEEYVKFLKSQGALVVGVTTAWREVHKDIVLKKVGLDDIVGTDFPIDKARKRLIRVGRWTQEMETTRKFLDESFTIIDCLNNANDEEKEKHVRNLRERIENFYVNTLGVSWDGTGKMVLANGHTTELASIMAECDVIGDKRKAEVAHQLFARHGYPGSVNVAIGDGFNDRRMLNESPWSIGINGAEAAKAAKIGVIAQNVGQPLIVITDLLRRNSDMRFVVEEAQRILGNRAIVHAGGPNLSKDLSSAHQKMKREIRGKGALLP